MIHVAEEAFFLLLRRRDGTVEHMTKDTPR